MASLSWSKCKTEIYFSSISLFSKSDPKNMTFGKNQKATDKNHSQIGTGKLWLKVGRQNGKI